MAFLHRLMGHDGDSSEGEEEVALLEHEGGSSGSEESGEGGGRACEELRGGLLCSYLTKVVVLCR